MTQVVLLEGDMTMMMIDAVYAGVSGTPWAASSGASAQDVWSGVTINFSHSSDDRDFSWNAQASFANEYDYTSIGFGGGLSQQFNEKRYVYQFDRFGFSR